MVHSCVPGPTKVRTPFGDASSMSDQQFLKCNCQHCGSPIEFPAHGVGLEINCPHCGQTTLLSKPRKSRVLAGALALVVLAALGGGGSWYFLAGPGARR